MFIRLRKLYDREIISICVDDFFDTQICFYADTTAFKERLMNPNYFIILPVWQPHFFMYVSVNEIVKVLIEYIAKNKANIVILITLKIY